jgi:hypothetical protein
LSQGGQALCGVVLDAVWHASQVIKTRKQFQATIVFLNKKAAKVN